MTDYLLRAASAWFLGFFPFLEIYAAVPAAFALGLDPVSAVTWPVLGNVAPVFLIAFAYERLLRIERLGRWLEGRRSERFERWTRRYGPPLVAVITPWIGVWAVAATAMALGMRKGPLAAYATLGIVVYAVAIGTAIVIGFDLAS